MQSFSREKSNLRVIINAYMLILQAPFVEIESIVIIVVDGIQHLLNDTRSAFILSVFVGFLQPGPKCFHNRFTNGRAVKREGILAVPDVREQSNSNLKALQESPYGNLFNYNALAKTQKNKNTLTAAISQSGSFTDSDGTWYVWSPVYYINNKNKIADNAIYLFIVAYHLTDAATPTADYLILTHKEEIQTFLQMDAVFA